MFLPVICQLGYDVWEICGLGLQKFNYGNINIVNIFKVIASGKHSFREEFVSAFFAYLLAPNMDHGLGSSFFSSLVKRIGDKKQNQKLLNLALELDDTLRTDFFNDGNGQVEIDIEFKYELPSGKSGFVDIVVHYKNWYFIVENKIIQTSKTKDQLREQYLGTRGRLIKLHGDNLSIVQIYLVPALLGQEGWSSSQAFQDELHTEYQFEDFGTLLYWQEPSDTEELSVLAILTDLLKKESMGAISPLSYDTKQIIKSFVNFCLNEFSGYSYTKQPLGKTIVQKDKIKVSDLLQQQDEMYVGIQWCKAGLIIKSWRNTSFKDELLTVSSDPKGWQYLPLTMFQKICTWAMDPDNNDLNGVEWQGKPFGAVNMYRVAKTAGTDIYIGIRGGIEKFKVMTEKEICAKEMWEVSNTRKSANWFSGTDYCDIVEEKNITSIIDKA